MNKKGANYSPLIWIGVILLVLYFAGPQLFAPTEEPAISEITLPSDKKTTVNLKFTDKLATTETAVAAEYQVFNSDGTYFTSASESTVGSDGLHSFDANVQEDYTIVAFDNSGQCHLPTTEEFNTGTKSEMAKTIKLVKCGTLKINGVDDPVDLDQNLTGTAGATEEFRIKWSVNASNSGIRRPVIVLDANDTTSIDDIRNTKPDTAGGKYSLVACPDRLTVSTTRKLYCFQRDIDAFADDGIIITSFSLVADSTVAPADDDYIEPKLIDEFIYFEPGYDSLDGVKYDFEDQADSDIGVSDSVVGDHISFQD